MPNLNSTDAIHEIRTPNKRDLLLAGGAFLIAASCGSGGSSGEETPTLITGLPTTTLELPSSTSLPEMSTTTTINIPTTVKPASTTNQPTTTSTPELSTTSTTIEKYFPQSEKPKVGERYSTIEIPKIGLIAGLYGYDGETNDPIDNENAINPQTGEHEAAVGYDIRSALIGDSDDYGNKRVGFGHRTSHTKPFSRFNELVPGDTLYETLADGTEVIWVMTDIAVVRAFVEVEWESSPEFNAWMAPGDGTPLTVLFACTYPPKVEGDITTAYGGGTSHRLMTGWVPMEYLEKNNLPIPVPQQG
jgi:sortase (surface protein transpeptidase)